MKVSDLKEKTDYEAVVNVNQDDEIKGRLHRRPFKRCYGKCSVRFCTCYYSGS